MRRRSKAGSEPAKTRRPKASAPKRHNAPKPTHRRSSLSTSQETKVAQLARERDEALEQLSATSEIFKVISSSPGDLKPVFDTILKKATRICAAGFGTLWLAEGDGLRAVAVYNAPPGFAELRRETLARPNPKTVVGRVLISKQPVQVVDIAADAAYAEGDPLRVALVEVAGMRTLLAVPMLKENELIGTINIYRQEVQAFTDKQIALLQNFAAQAVIAVENTRLLNELKQSLEQQTATADVLRVISSSPGELEAVFRTILENATRICEAKFGILNLYVNGGLCFGAMHNVPSAFADWLQSQRGAYQPIPGSPPDRVIRTKKVSHVLDNTAEPAPGRAATLGGARTTVSVPMLKDDELIGIITIFRQEVRAFTDDQIVLLANFANQAVIAIESARLVNELRESLEQQIATSEVLRVISSSQGELQPVFEAILENAVVICQANFGNLWLRRGDLFEIVAIHGGLKEYRDYLFAEPLVKPDAESAMGRIATRREAVQIEDIGNAPTHGMRMRIATIRIAKARTLVGVPMLRDNEVVGIIAVYRQEVRLFDENQIGLLKNFAAQAVIAIENARLLNELRESLDRQTATADVLGVISRSLGDLKPVFDTILERAVRLCEATHGHVWRYDGEKLHAIAVRGDEQFVRWLRDHNSIPPIRGSAADRIAKGEQLVHVTDRRDEDAYRDSPVFRQLVDASGIRASLSVALRSDKALLGMINVYRQEARPFTDRQVELVKNFAAQAVIAIENARLLNELRQRTVEVGNLNQRLEQRVADQVGEIERMSRLRRFLPPQVADLIVASGTEKQLESHRREITALFCDLRGFTGFSESSDPEDVMSLLREYHEAIGQIIIKYSGTLERYAGDGVMVVFNDPVPVEKPALQAVLMALEMRVAIGALTETWHRWGHDIGFGIGIAHGFATLGTIGFEGRFDYAAIGTVSNVASRLCDEAKPGQILISPRVLTKVENAVTVEPVGEFTLKGIRRPMTAYNVLAASPSKSD